MELTNFPVPSFTVEGFLRSATLPEKEKDSLVNTYAALLTSHEIGITEENQLSLLTTEFLKEIKIPFGHAVAIAEAAKKIGKKESVESEIQRVLQTVKKIEYVNRLHNIPLQERSNQLREVVTLVAENLQRIDKPKQQISYSAKTDIIIPTFAGGSGIGKTALAYESAQHLFREWKKIVPEQFQEATLLYLMIDFSNVGKLLFAEKDLHPTILVGLRLAYCYFLQEKYVVNYPEFCQSCATSLELFTVSAVLEAIRKDLQLADGDKLFIVLHIDEMQCIFDFESEYKWETSPNPKGLFKLLIYEICSFLTLGKSVIQPFVSGTAHSLVMQSKDPTMYTFKFIDIPLLSFGAVFKLIEHYATLFHVDCWQWKMKLPFLQLLGDMGGLPRAVNYLLQACFGANFSKGSSFFENISSQSFFPIFMDIAKSIDEKYGLQGFILENKEVALLVLSHAIRNISVTRDQVLGNVAIAQMEQRGHVFLHQVGTDYFFRMPFIFIFIYNQYLRIIPNDLADMAFNQDNKMEWQTWESFNALFQVFMNNLLLHEKGRVKMTLGNFYHKADGHDDTKNLIIELDTLEVARVLHQFPSKTQPVLYKDTAKPIDWTTCRYLLLNGKSAEFGDTVLIRAVEKETAQKYFGRTVNTIIISGQQKWDYNGEDFTVDLAQKEHQKALDTAKRAGIADSFGIITAIFTTQCLPKDKIQSIPKDILIIHQENYYGPFSTRAAFSIAHTFNPNFADIKHLQVLEGVGEETAMDIAQERLKRPFENLDDLCNRVKRVKKDKITCELSFFPFTSKHPQ